MNNKLISIAIIGVGNMANRYAQELLNLKDAQVSCVVSKDLSKADEFVKKYSKLMSENYKIFSSHIDALNWGNFDAVFVCTWHDSHVPIGCDCLIAGKAVFMEKPLALSLQACKPLLKFSENNSDVRFMMGGFGFRYYNHSVYQLLQYLDTPKIIIGRFVTPRWPDDFWAMDPIKGGGVFLSAGSHLMDIVSLVSHSEPINIFAFGDVKQHQSNDIDTIAAVIEFKNGVHASIAFGDCGEVSGLGEMTLEVFDGTRSARIDQFLPSTRKPIFTERSGYFSEPKEMENQNQESLKTIPSTPTEEFITYVRTGQRSVLFPTLQDGVRALVLMQKALQSIHCGRPMEIKGL